jgi:hypothetical protein
MVQARKDYGTMYIYINITSHVISISLIDFCTWWKINLMVQWTIIPLVIINQWVIVLLTFMDQWVKITLTLIDQGLRIKVDFGQRVPLGFKGSKGSNGSREQRFD